MSIELVSEIQRILALRDKASAGDWEVRDFGAKNTPDDLDASMAYLNCSHWSCFAGVVVRMQGEEGLEEEAEGRANVEFIAAAPQMANLLEKLLPLAQSQQWQPIETAPKDGTYVDLLHEDGTRLTDCYWNAAICCWDCGGAWHPDGSFTHYMPLPKAPA